MRHVVVADPEEEARARVAATIRGVADGLGPLAVDHAETGTEALLLIDRHRPPLVVTEVLLPELNGLGLIRKVVELARELDSAPPVFIVVTTMAREMDRYWALRTGAHAYVTKPFDQALLQARIRDVLVAGKHARPDRVGV